MITKQIDSADRIRRLLSREEANIRQAFERMLAQIRNELTLTEVADLIERGAISEAFDRMQASITAFGAANNAALIASGAAVADDLRQALQVVVSFDVTNQRAVDIMRAKRLRLIRNITTEQEKAVRQALERGIAAGQNPIAQARTFRSAIGLTAKQEAAVANFRRLLEAGSAEALTRELRDRRFDRTVLRGVRGEPLTAKQINRMVTRYRERFLKFRSETIARTEALRAVHEGAEEMWAQAIQNRQVSANELVRTWVTARDERVRGSHRTMNGQQQAVNVSFTSGAGNRLMFPGDPAAPASETIKCRCVVTVRLESAA